jgi:carbon storage regulator
MLVFTRHIGETVMIGENVLVRVLGIQGRQVRLGFQAPSPTSIHREEIFERIKRQRTEGLVKGNPNCSLMNIWIPNAGECD